MAQAPVRKLAHKTDNFSIDVDGKSNAEIIREIREANYTIGTKTLADLLSGEREEAGSFRIFTVKFTKEDQDKRKAEAAAAKKAKADAAKAAKAAKAQPAPENLPENAGSNEEGSENLNENADDSMANEGGAAWKFKTKAELDAEAEAKALADNKAQADAAVNEPAGTAPVHQPEATPAVQAPVQTAPIAPTVPVPSVAPVQRRAPRQLTPEPGTAPAAPAAPRAPKKEVKYTQPTDGSKPKIIWEHPDAPIPIRLNTKIDNMFKMLCRPEGATKAEMMEKFGWTEGGLGSVLFWEPKAKGYALVSEKGEDGVLHYFLHFRHGAGRVKPEQILYFGSPAPKAQPAANPAPAANNQTRVSVPKDALANVPPLGGMTVRRRVAAKKPA